MTAVHGIIVVNKYMPYGWLDLSNVWIVTKAKLVLMFSCTKLIKVGAQVGSWMWITTCVVWFKGDVFK